MYGGTANVSVSIVEGRISACDYCFGEHVFPAVEDSNALHGGDSNAPDDGDSNVIEHRNLLAKVDEEEKEFTTITGHKIINANTHEVDVNASATYKAPTAEISVKTGYTWTHSDGNEYLEHLRTKKRKTYEC